MVGLGFDAHELVEGRKLILGGVEIRHARGLEGHSDGDCLTHAIIDALLGAAGMGDIGKYFPPTKKYKGISSMKLLKQVVKLVTRRYKIVNIDCTVISDEVKIAPHAARMKRKIAAIVGKVPLNVKGKTGASVFSGTIVAFVAVEVYRQRGQ